MIIPDCNNQLCSMKSPKLTQSPLSLTNSTRCNIALMHSHLPCYSNVITISTSDHRRSRKRYYRRYLTHGFVHEQAICCQSNNPPQRLISLTLQHFTFHFSNSHDHVYHLYIYSLQFINSPLNPISSLLCFS